jgi:O-antigen ligase
MAVLLAALLDTRRATSRAIYALVAAGAAIAALNCLQFSTSSWESSYLGFAGVRYQNLYGHVDGFRAIGPVNDPNYHAQFLLPLLVLALERTWNAAGRERAAAALAGFALAPALALTYSRGALLAIAALLPVAIVAAVRWRVPALGLALTLGMAGTAVAAAPELLARTRTFVVAEPEQALDDGAVRGRLSENLSALQMFADHPWNGVGLGSFPRRYHEYASRLGLDTRPRRSAHNLYLEVAAETGLLGLLGFMTLLGGVLGNVVRTHRALIEEYCVDGARRVVGVAMALAAYFTTALFLHMTYRSMFWVWVALGFALPTMRRVAASAPRPAGDAMGPAPVPAPLATKP